MMNQEQAAEIHRHLQAAVRAMRRAEHILWDQDQETRAEFGEHYARASSALHFNLLLAIYKRFPELKPPQPRGRIDSKLRWKQVRLPPGITETDVDAIIFSVMKSHWQKVAMVLTMAHKRCEELSLSINFEEMAARIQELAKADRIEAVGDLRKWRFSEIRLKN